MVSELIVRTESVASIEAAVPVPLEPPGSVAELLVSATAASAAVAVPAVVESVSVSVPALDEGVGSEAAPPSCAVVIPSDEEKAPPTDEELDAIQLDAVKLHAYQVALELHSLCSSLVSAFPNRIVRDQLERASLSVVLNCAEGGGRRSRRDKARFYTIARGSATEVAALMDVLERRHLAPLGAIRNGRRLSIRIVQMLTKMSQKLLP